MICSFLCLELWDVKTAVAEWKNSDEPPICTHHSLPPPNIQNTNENAERGLKRLNLPPRNQGLDFQKQIKQVYVKIKVGFRYFGQAFLYESIILLSSRDR